jgi:hypothetical protein
MINKFPKRMLRATGMSIRIKRIIHKFSYVENHVKRRKVPREN